MLFIKFGLKVDALRVVQVRHNSTVYSRIITFSCNVLTIIGNRDIS